MKYIFKISLNYLRLSIRKLRVLCKNLGNKSYKTILMSLQLLPKKITVIILTLLKSINLNILKKSEIFILTSFGTKGPILQRIQPRAKGQSYPIQKKFTHLHFILCSISNKKLLSFINFFN